MKKFRIYGTLALLLLIMVVIIQNRETVDTELLFITVSMPRAALLAVTLLAGVIIGMLFATFGFKSKK